MTDKSTKQKLLEILLLPAAIVFTGLFTLLSRMAGGAKPKLSFGLDQWLYALPYAGIAFFGLLSLSGSLLTPYPWWIWLGTGLAFLGAFSGKRTGHGSYMTLPFSKKKLKKGEKADYLLNLIFGKDPRLTSGNDATAIANIAKYGETKLYLRNLTGLAVTGLWVTLFAAVALLVSGHVIGSIALATTGAMKAVAYGVSWKLIPSGRASWWVNHEADDYKYNFFRDEFSEANQFGEAGTGLFGAIGIVIGVLDILQII